MQKSKLSSYNFLLICSRHCLITFIVYLYILVKLLLRLPWACLDTVSPEKTQTSTVCSKNLMETADSAFLLTIFHSKRYGFRQIELKFSLNVRCMCGLWTILFELDPTIPNYRPNRWSDLEFVTLLQGGLSYAHRMRRIAGWLKKIFEYRWFLKLLMYCNPGSHQDFPIKFSAYEP